MYDDLTDFVTEDKLMTFADHMRYASSNKVLLEGHFASWDIKKLGNEIQNIFGGTIDEITVQDLPSLFKTTKYGNVLTLKVKLFGFPTDEQFEQLKRVVEQFGYYFASPFPLEQRTLRFQIEPRYPVKINEYLKENNIRYGYHVTLNNERLEKIKTIGLAPKSSQTTFNHPGNRIYMMALKPEAPLSDLNSWIEVLARNKNKSVNDFVIIKVDLDQDKDYYIDDTATIAHYSMIAIFTPQNIKPTKLTIL